MVRCSEAAVAFAIGPLKLRMHLQMLLQMLLRMHLQKSSRKYLQIHLQMHPRRCRAGWSLL